MSTRSSLAAARRAVSVLPHAFGPSMSTAPTAGEGRAELAVRDPWQVGHLHSPSLAAIADILRAGGSEPDELLRLVTFNVVVGSTDAHAKSTSFLRLPDGTARLAPAYDTALHLHSEASSGIAAMDVAGRRAMRKLTAEDLVTEGVKWGLPAGRAARAVVITLEQLTEAIAEVDRDAHPGVSAAAWSTVEERTGRLAAQAAPFARPRRRGERGRRDAAPQGRVPKGSPAGGQLTVRHRP